MISFPHRLFKWIYKTIISAIAVVLITLVLGLSLISSILQSNLKFGNMAIYVEKLVTPDNIFYPYREFKGVTFSYKGYKLYFPKISASIIGWNLVGESESASFYSPALDKPAELSGVTISALLSQILDQRGGVTANGSLNSARIVINGVNYHLKSLDLYLKDDKFLYTDFNLSRYQSNHPDWDVRAANLSGEVQLDATGKWRTLNVEFEDAQIVNTGLEKLWTYRGNKGVFGLTNDTQIHGDLRFKEFQLHSFTPVRPDEKFKLILEKPELSFTQKKHQYWDTGKLKAIRANIVSKNQHESFSYTFNTPALEQSHLIEKEKIKLPFHITTDDLEIVHKRKERKTKAILKKLDLDHAFQIDNQPGLSFFSVVDEIMDMDVSNYRTLLQSRSFTSLPLNFSIESSQINHPEITWTSKKLTQHIGEFQFTDQSTLSTRSNINAFHFRYLNQYVKASSLKASTSLASPYTLLYPILNKWILPENHPEKITGDQKVLIKSWYKASKIQTQLKVSDFDTSTNWDQLNYILFDEIYDKKTFFNKLSRISLKTGYFSGRKNPSVQWSQISSTISYGNIKYHTKHFNEYLSFTSLDLFHRQNQLNSSFVLPFRLNITDGNYLKQGLQADLSTRFNKMTIALEAKADHKTGSELLTYINKFRAKGLKETYLFAQKKKVTLKRVRVYFNHLKIRSRNTKFSANRLNIENRNFNFHEGFTVQDILFKDVIFSNKENRIYMGSGYYSGYNYFVFEKLYEIFNSWRNYSISANENLRSLVYYCLKTLRTKTKIEISNFSYQGSDIFPNTSINKNTLKWEKISLQFIKPAYTKWDKIGLYLKGGSFNGKWDNTLIKAKVGVLDFIQENIPLTPGTRELPIALKAQSINLDIGNKKENLSLMWDHLQTSFRISLKRLINQSFTDRLKLLSEKPFNQQLTIFKDWNLKVSPVELSILGGRFRKGEIEAKLNQLDLTTGEFNFGKKPMKFSTSFEGLYFRNHQEYFQADTGRGKFYRTRSDHEFKAIIDKLYQEKTEYLNLFELINNFLKNIHLVTNWNVTGTKASVSRTHFTKWFSLLKPQKQLDGNHNILIGAEKSTLSLIKHNMTPWNHFKLALHKGRLIQFQKNADMHFEELKLIQDNRQIKNNRVALPFYIFSKNWSLKDQQNNLLFKLSKLNSDFLIEMDGNTEDSLPLLLKEFLLRPLDQFSEHISNKNFSLKRFNIKLSELYFKDPETEIRLKNIESSAQPFYYEHGSLKTNNHIKQLGIFYKNEFIETQDISFSLDFLHNRLAFTKLLSSWLQSDSKGFHKSLRLALEDYSQELTLDSSLNMDSVRFKIGREFLNLFSKEIEENVQILEGKMGMLALLIVKHQPILWDKAMLTIADLNMKLPDKRKIASEIYELNLHHELDQDHLLIPVDVNVLNFSSLMPEKEFYFSDAQFIGTFQTDSHRMNLIHIFNMLLSSKKITIPEDFFLKKVTSNANNLKIISKNKETKIGENNFQLEKIQLSNMSGQGKYQLGNATYRDNNSNFSLQHGSVEGSINQNASLIIPLLFNSIFDENKYSYRETLEQILLYLETLNTDQKFDIQNLKSHQDERHAIVLKKFEGKLNLKSNKKEFSLVFTPKIELDLQNTNHKTIPFPLTADQIFSQFNLQVDQLKLNDIRPFLFNDQLLLDQIQKKQSTQQKKIDMEMSMFFDGERDFEDLDDEEQEVDQLEILSGFYTAFRKMSSNIKGTIQTRLSSGTNTSVSLKGPANQLFPQIFADLWQWERSRRYEEERIKKNKSIDANTVDSKSGWDQFKGKFQRGWNSFVANVKTAFSSLTKNIALLLFDDEKVILEIETTSKKDNITEKVISESEDFQLLTMNWLIRIFNNRFLNPGLQKSLAVCKNPNLQQKITLKALQEKINIPFEKPDCMTLYQYATRADILDLSNQDIEDITPLAALKDLKELNLSNNRIVKTETLSFIKALKKLDLSHNQIADISFLKKLPSLKELDLSKNLLTDIQSINSSFSLRKLRLSSNQISSIDPIKDLIGLQELNLSSNRISHLNSIIRLKKITNLNLSDNILNKLYPIKHLIRLKQLDVSANPLADCAPSNLKSLKRGLYCQ